MTNNQPLSFSQAIQNTKQLMEKIQAQELNENDIEQEVTAIVSSKNGGRGFFVTYLTSELVLADDPSAGILKGLKSAQEIVSELLVKNLAMSSAMTITHHRNQDTSNVEGSQKVCRRTSNLIQQIEMDLIKQELEQLKSTIMTGQGKYQDFLKRWGYDVEQQQAIQEAITQTLAEQNKQNKIV